MAEENCGPPQRSLTGGLRKPRNKALSCILTAAAQCIEGVIGWEQFGHCCLTPRAGITLDPLLAAKRMQCRFAGSGQPPHLVGILKGSLTTSVEGM